VLGHFQRESRHSRKLAGEFLRFRHQIIRREDAVDETDFIGPLRIDLGAAEDELLGAAHADDPGEALGAAPPGDEADQDFRLAEKSLLRREADVAGHRNLHPAAQREAVHRGDDGLRHDLHLPEGFVPQFHKCERLLRTQALHLGDVGAGHEGPVPRPGEDQHLDRFIRFADRDGGQQFGHCL